MAREESPREDLMREAVALVQRIEFQVEGESSPVVAGFRRDGSISLYFGEDPVVQFNTRQQIRRGFHAGQLIKAERERLVALTRVRTERETELLRHELSDEETRAYLQEIQGRLSRLRAAIDQQRCVVLRQVPQDEDVLLRVRQWLDSLGDTLPIASAPNAG